MPNSTPSKEQSTPQRTPIPRLVKASRQGTNKRVPEQAPSPLPRLIQPKPTPGPPAPFPPPAPQETSRPSPASAPANAPPPRPTRRFYDPFTNPAPEPQATFSYTTSPGSHCAPTSPSTSTPTPTRTEWTASEDTQLMQLLQPQQLRHDPRALADWTSVARSFRGRGARDCKARFLDVCVTAVAAHAARFPFSWTWLAEEEAVVMVLRADGWRWDALAELLPKRKWTACERRFTEILTREREREREGEVVTEEEVEVVVKEGEGN